MNWSELKEDLDRLKKADLYRDPDILSPRRSGQRLDIYTDFSSNDYLGLSRHPRVIAKAVQGARRWGAGSAASRLLSGNLGIHVELEERIAAFKKEESALVFSSGYLANLGAVSALLSEKDVVILDRLNHASLVDAARLSKAKLWVYPHRDMGTLKKLLERSRHFRRRLVLTDAYFSMDGTVAPLDELQALCEEFDAVLYVDEAHSTGVYGKTGGGLTEHYGLSGRIPVVMGTLSKALGSVGGFIAGRKVLREMLVNRCREFIYTTGPSPSASAAAMEALGVVRDTPSLRDRLWENVRSLRGLLCKDGFDLMGSEGPVIPILTFDTKKTIRFKEYLKKGGYLVSAIRPPTVPRGTDRIRVSVSAGHTMRQLMGLARAMKKARGTFL